MFWMASGNTCKVCLEFLLLCLLSRNNAERSMKEFKLIPGRLGIIFHALFGEKLCTYGCYAYICVCTLLSCLVSTEAIESMNSIVVELQIVLSHYMGGGNQTQVSWRAASALNHCVMFCTQKKKLTLSLKQLLRSLVKPFTQHALSTHCIHSEKENMLSLRTVVWKWPKHRIFCLRLEGCLSS